MIIINHLMIWIMNINENIKLNMMKYYYYY